MANHRVDSESDVLLSSDHFKERCGIFYRNVEKFLELNGRQVDIPADVQCWLVTLNDNNLLHVYVEPTGTGNATCDQCRILGWGVHPVSKARYHFIVPAQSGPDSLEDPASLPAIAEAAFSSGAQQTTLPTQVLTGLAGLKMVRLPTNKKRPDAHFSPYNAPSTIFDSSRHCLHGVIHTNGFGHLLRVNGHEGGGRKYSGTQMVDLWDTLCQGLGAKKITVEDVSSKNGMELRVLYSIACGYTWYGGKWGFTYGRGPFNMTEYNWTSAWRHVAAATLSNLLYDFEGLEPGVPAIVKRYRLPVCGAAKVRDLGTLFMRLLYLQARPKEARPFFDEKEVHSATEMMRRLDEERFHSMVGRGRGRGPGRGRGRGQGRGLKTVSQNDFHGESSKGQVGAVVPGKTKRQDRIHGSTDTTNSRASCTSLHGTRILWYCRTRSVWYQGRIVEQSSTPGSGSLYVVDFGNDLFAELDLANDEDVKFYDNNERPSFLDAKKKKDFTFGWDVENKERKCEQEKEKQVNPPVTKHVASSQQTLASPPRVVTKILRYKAHLSRPQDNIERARQLSRALKALFPAAKEYLGQGKTRKELDTAFEALVGDGVPKPTYRGEWWEYLYIILQWAQSVVDNLGSGEALNASRTIDSAINNDGKVIEIDVDVLHDLGLYPENWPIPLTAEGVRRSNVQANRSSGPNQLSQPSRQTKTPSVPSSVAPPTTTLPGDQDINDAVTGTGIGAGAGADTGADGCTNIAASETRIRLKLPENMPAIHLGCRRCRKPRLGCRECRARELEKLKVSGAVELVALIGADSCCGVSPGCPKCWRRALGAMGHPQFSGGRESDQAAFNGNTRPSRPSAAKREIYQDVERHVRRKTTHLGKGVDLKTKTREKSIPLLDPVKIRELVQSPPGPEELPESALALPLNSVLIDANLPNLKVPHCNVEGPLGTAILALCSAAASHKDLWLSPARLMTLAEQSLDTNRKEQAVPVIQMALAHLGDTQHHGWAFRRADHPHGGVMYLARPIPRAVAPRTRACFRPEAQQEAVDAALSSVVFAPPLALASQSSSLPLSTSHASSTHSPPPPPPSLAPPPQPWISRAPGGDLPPESSSDADVKMQVTRDLQYLFTAVIRTYAPAIAKIAAENAAISTGQRAATRVLKLRQLPEEVVILRDTKHFVKVYKGKGTQAPGTKIEGNAVDSSLVTLSCRLSLPRHLTEPPVPNLTRLGRKFIPVEPPAELITMRGDASVTELLEKVTETFQSIYLMCSKFVAVDILSAGILGKSRVIVPQHRNATINQFVDQVTKAVGSGDGPGKVLRNTTAKGTLNSVGGSSSKSKSGTSSVVNPVIVTITVAGIDLDLSTPEWLHAGGPEDWIVACSCGTRDDDGEAMVSCDACGVWWHTRCARAPEDTEYDSTVTTESVWVCPACAKKQQSYHV